MCTSKNIIILFLMLTWIFPQKYSGVINLYPWNLSSAVFLTKGDYSTGEKYASNAFYFSMDRHWKDRFMISYEKLTIQDESENFEQYNLFGKDYFVIRSWLSLGGIVGHFETNTQESAILMDITDLSGGEIIGTLNRVIRSGQAGWIIGIQVMGDLKKLGYSFNYISSSYLDMDDFTDNYDYPAIYQDTTYQYQSSSRTRFEQAGISVSKKFGDHIFRIGISGILFPEKRYFSGHGVWEWQVSNVLYSTLTMGSGESRYAVDPFALLVNNNPDILQLYFSQNLSMRLSTHWTIYSNLSYHQYKSFDLNNSYRSQYFTLGIRIRI